MKNAVLTVVLILFIFQGFSQGVNESTRKKFSTVIDVFNDFYVDVPDSVDNRFLNPGFSFQGLYDYRFGKSDFSFAFGAGLGSHNFYSDAMIETDSLGVTQLHPISSLYPDINYDKNKITYTYLDVPLEFRLRTKNNIRAALGFKVGFLISSHTKYKGDDFLFGTNDALHVKLQKCKQHRRFEIRSHCPFWMEIYQPDRVLFAYQCFQKRSGSRNVSFLGWHFANAFLIVYFPCVQKAKPRT